MGWVELESCIGQVLVLSPSEDGVGGRETEYASGHQNLPTAGLYRCTCGGTQSDSHPARHGIHALSY